MKDLNRQVRISCQIDYCLSQLKCIATLKSHSNFMSASLDKMRHMLGTHDTRYLQLFNNCSPVC